ncbi:MAG: DNA-3-methyladenine glycosylase [Kiritimatiellae bacterium]|nr:DNA-3-methyladenine glycosylase [Kiritimatiellia bacterium]
MFYLRWWNDAYVYLCYGMHEMLNVVSSPPRRASASPTPPRATSVANGGLRLSNNYGFFKKFLGALAA